MSQEEFQNELSYIVSVKILNKLLDNGFLTKEEYRKIDLLNRKSFKPKLAEIMA